MNDDFIYAALPKVPKDFSRSLYAKISVEISSQSRTHSRVRNPRRVQIAIIILGLLLLVAWSQVRLWVRYVPIGDLWLVELSQQSQIATGNEFATPFVPTPRQLPTVISDGTVYEFWQLKTLSPDWVPDGFSAAEIPASMISYEETLGMWSNNAQEKIRLFAVPVAGGMHPYAPPGMYEQIQINGQPAILIYGRLALKKPQDNSRKWDETLGFQLSWGFEESVYTLETFGAYISENDLIRMAESMKEADCRVTSC